MSTRRQFVKQFSVLAAIATVPGLSWAIGKKKKKKTKKEEKAAGTSLIDLSKKDDPAVKTAAGLGYVAKTAEAIKAGKVSERGGYKPEEQKCANCVLAVKDGDNYKCQVIAGVYVHPTGWCTSWNPKAPKS